MESTGGGNAKESSNNGSRGRVRTFHHHRAEARGGPKAGEKKGPGNKIISRKGAALILEGQYPEESKKSQKV